MISYKVKGSSGNSADKESACSARDPGLIPGSERSAGEGNSYPFQYSGQENLHELYSPWGHKSLSHDLVVLVLGIYPRKMRTYIHTKTCN